MPPPELQPEGFAAPQKEWRHAHPAPGKHLVCGIHDHANGQRDAGDFTARPRRQFYHVAQGIALPPVGGLRSTLRDVLFRAYGGFACANDGAGKAIQGCSRARYCHRKIRPPLHGLCFCCRVPAARLHERARRPSSMQPAGKENGMLSCSELPVHFTDGGNVRLDIRNLSRRKSEFTQDYSGKQ